MYETCNEYNGKDDGGMHYYLYGPSPKEIEKYIAEFGPNDGSSVITNNSAMVECHGYWCGCHSFLKAEGFCFYSTCNVLLCHFCSSEYNEDANAVWNVFIMKKIHGLGVEEMTEAAMRDSLQEHEMNIPASATYQQILLLYDDIVEKQKTSCLHDRLPLVQYPVMPTDWLVTNLEINQKFTFTNAKLCQVICDDYLTIADVCMLITLLNNLAIMFQNSSMQPPN